MKKYWQYMKDYQEATENITKPIAMPEIWIALKFLSDNGIGNPYIPDEEVKMLKVLENYSSVECALFMRAIYDTLESLM